MSIEKAKMRELFEFLVKSRLVEEKLLDLNSRGEFLGFVHSCIGQEAIPVGTTCHLQKGDYWNCARGHIQSNIVLGMDLKRMFAEFQGKKAGYCGGKGGKVHLCYPEIGNMGFRGIQGAYFGLCLGTAHSQKMRKTDNVTLCFFGDGASSQGLFAEALNLSSLYRLPLIFVCSNNQYSMHTHFREETVTENIADRGLPYKVPGFVVDGNDLEAVFETAGRVIRNAREGKGPAILEAKTMRMRGHLEGDQQVYRDLRDVEEWKKKDPLERFTRRVQELGVLDEGEIKRMTQRVQGEIDEAVAFAREAPHPASEDLLQHVFCEA
jgi:acetoin:2,6-dichlorophenolindophenol oxidoreductase subunit alpha